MLYQAWTGTGVGPDVRTTSKFMVDLKDSLEEMVRLTQDSVQVGSARNRRYQQRKAKVRSLVAEQKVLVLLPDGHSKMLLRWKGPVLVVKKVNVYNYVVKVDDGVEKLFHINLLKEFVERPEVAAVDLKHCHADVQEAGQIFVRSGWVLQKVCTQLCLCGCSTGGVDEMNQPAKVKWSEACQEAFEKLKTALSSEPVVRLPDFKKAFTTRSAASGAGIGAVLMQCDDEGCLHPVLVASRKLLDRETRYSTVEKECLALVWAVDKFHRYIFGREFVIETDHRPLTYLKISCTTNGRLMRWALALQDYSFTVMPISGSTILEADVLSRLV